MLSPVKIWRNQQWIKQLLYKQGEVLTWTMIRVPPGTHTEYAPYILALIQLSTGKRLTVPLVDTDPSSVQKGMKIKTVLRRLTHPDHEGIIQYGIKAIPLSL